MTDTTIAQLLHNLFNTPTPPMIDLPDGTHRKAEGNTKSIRVTPHVRKFYDYHANRLDISLQAILSLTLEAVMESSINPEGVSVGNSIERFKHLFRSHDIIPLYIADFIRLHTGHEFSLQDLSDDECLSKWMQYKHIDSLSRIFGVSLSWLEGQSMKPVEVMSHVHRDWAFSFHKRLKAIEDRINGDASEDRPEGSAEVRFEIKIIVPESGDPTIHEGFCYQANQMQIICVQHFSYTGGTHPRTISLFHNEGVIPWFNNEIRIGLKAALAYAHERGIHIEGHTFSNTVYKAILNGALPADWLSQEVSTQWNPLYYIPNALNQSELDINDTKALVEQLRTIYE